MLSPSVNPGILTELDRFIFESWGYLVMPGILNTEEIGEAYDACVRLHSSRESGFGQVGRGFETEPILERLIDHPEVMPKVRGLLGDRFILQANWNTMQPAKGDMGRWHQDGSSAYDFGLVAYPAPLLQLRVSYILTDQSLPGLGNMELIPGSHRSPVPVPQSVRGSGGDVPISQVICASAGSVLMFHNAVWHRTYKHSGEKDRYTAHYVYSPPWMRAADRLGNSDQFMRRTTPLRRALMGEFSRPDAPYGANYEGPNFDG